MIAHTEFEQNSVEWSLARAGKITASEMDAIISPLGQIRKGLGVRTYLNQKLCERWTGGPLFALQGVFDIEQGRILEERAKPAFTVHTGIEIDNVAFIETDNRRAGCSPDGMLPKIGSGVEIKCPRLDTHVGYLLSGELPPTYTAQVQGSMFVTGCATWHFFSYHRSLPPLHLVVERNDEFQEALETAVDLFIEKLDAAFRQLLRINGGPPKKRAVPTQQPAAERIEINV